MFTSRFRVKSYVWITSFVLCDTDGYNHRDQRRFPKASQGGLSGGPLRDTTSFWGGGCDKDWKFLCWGDSVISWICHAKE